MNILAGTLKPNFGNLDTPPTDEQISERYANTSLGDYFKRLYSGNIKISYKPQRIDLLPKHFEGTVKELLKKADEKGISQKLAKDLGMDHLMDRNIRQLSGGELQKVAIIAAASKKQRCIILTSLHLFRHYHKNKGCKIDKGNCRRENSSHCC